MEPGAWAPAYWTDGSHGGSSHGSVTKRLLPGLFLRRRHPRVTVMTGKKKLFSKRHALIAGVIVLVALGAFAALYYSGFDWQRIPRTMEKLNTAVLLALGATLPLAGFPISLVYLSLGARFGPLAGLAVVIAITALHLVATHWIARSFLRKRLTDFIEGRGHKVPQVPKGENTSVSLIVMLAPGIPYFIRNYVLALSGILFRIYFCVALPVHLLRSFVVLFLGDLGSAPSGRGAVVLALIYGTKFAIFAVVAWRLRLRHRRRHGTAKMEAV